MKKLLVLLISIITCSCSIDQSENATSSYQEFIPISSVTMPEEFVIGYTYTIELKYFRPTRCHTFKDIYHSTGENIVAIIGTVFQNENNCSSITSEAIELETELNTSFNFNATETGVYTFKFWQGDDENGNSMYLIKEIPVVE